MALVRGGHVAIGYLLVHIEKAIASDETRSKAVNIVFGVETRRAANRRVIILRVSRSRTRFVLNRQLNDGPKCQCAWRRPIARHQTFGLRKIFSYKNQKCGFGIDEFFAKCRKIRFQIFNQRKKTLVAGTQSGRRRQVASFALQARRPSPHATSKKSLCATTTAEKHREPFSANKKRADKRAIGQ